MNVLTLADRQRIFGPIEYELNPRPGNPENITIQGNWIKDNIILVDIPWSNDGAKRLKVQFHKKAADSLVAWFTEMQHLQLLSSLLTFDGTFCPRLIRGGHTLSNHAFGTAIDLNSAWNPLGASPIAEGVKGSVMQIVPIAAKYGFFWGGNYHNRKDGMHFEYSIDPGAIS